MAKEGKEVKKVSIKNILLIIAIIWISLGVTGGLLKESNPTTGAYLTSIGGYFGAVFVFIGVIVLIGKFIDSRHK